MMLVLSYLAALAIGIPLGLIGGGGSIMTIPVLVYLFKVDPVSATAYSLFVVGVSSLFGVVPKYRQGLVDLKRGLVFGIPSIISVFLTRKIIVPSIPAIIYSSPNFEISKAFLMMTLFAVLMVFASVSMIRDRRSEEEEQSQPVSAKNNMGIILEGFLIGMLTGFVGAGGGFLIIPALVYLGKLPMKKAVGTSLLIISANSLFGFTGDLLSRKMDWILLFTVTSLAVVGIFLGHSLSHKVDGPKLKRGFGWFVLVMGIYIIVQQLFFPLPHAR
jgi:uncharacterized membrane protein YfcA